MIPLFLQEVEEACKNLQGDDRIHTVSCVTGRLAAPYIKKAYECVHKKYPNVTLHVYDITNNFFGEHITVAGLLTGQDIIAQLKGKELGERLLLTCNVLREGETVFLDDITVEELETALQIQTSIVKSDGKDFVHAVLHEEGDFSGRDKQPYEVT